MNKKTLREKLLSLFIALLFVGTTLSASVVSNPKPASAAYSPVQSTGLSLSTVSGGFYHSLALTRGTVWAWGDNSEGQLGNNDSNLQNSSTPVEISDFANVIAVAAGGAHSLALSRDGTVWAWGNNEYGQAGFGQEELLAGGPNYYIPDQYKKTYVPHQVEGLTDVVAIAAGTDYSLALKADGTVWAWGNNEYGQLGSPSPNGRTFTTTPVQVVTDINGNKLTDVTKISAGSAFALALKKDGTVWTWGGLLVDSEGIHNTVSQAQQVYSLTDVIGISAGWSHSLALKNDGTVWGWGDNQLFQIGNRSTKESWNKPLQISGLNHVQSIAAGCYLSLVLKTDGTVWSLGGSMWGQLGDGVDFEKEPAAIAPVQVKGLTNVTAIASGLGFGIARQGGGNLWAWGANSAGQLGNNTFGGPIETGNETDPTGNQISGVNSPVKALLQLEPFGGPSFTRIAGYDAMQTSVKISQQEWQTGAKTVILATVGNFPDALASAPLAHQYDAPVLLTESNRLTPSVEQEIGRLSPSKIIIVGGTAVVSQEIEDLLKQNYDVTRIAGFDQYETAAKIANYLHSVNPEISGKAVIAYGGNFPDALSISSWAAYHNIPILLTKQTILPSATKDALQNLNVTESIIVGGTAVVGPQVEAQLTGVKRYFGNDQYQTGIAIALGLGDDYTNVYIATGENFPDALAGSSMAARSGSPIILVDKNLNSSAVMNFLSNHNLNILSATVLGGTAVVSPTVWDKLTHLFSL